MHEIKALIRPTKLDDVLRALHEHPDLPGVTVSHVTGFGRAVGRENGDAPQYDSVRMSKLECLVPDALCEAVVALIADKAHTGRPGDGKIAIIAVEDVVRIRTGERGSEAL